MGIWKIVSGILSIILCFFVIFQSFAAGLFNILSGNGQSSGTAGLIVAALLLVGGIVSIVTRDAISSIGNIVIMILFGGAAAVGYILAGAFSDLIIWSTWCLLCAVMAAVSMAADNISGALTYFLILLIGFLLALSGLGLNLLRDSEASSDFKALLQEKKDENQADGAQEGNENPEEEAGEPDSAPEPASTGTPGEMPSSGNLGDYHVEIKNALLGEDYEGNPALIITYSWTNNSDETTSAMSEFVEQAFQQGVEMDRATVRSSDIYNSDAYTKDIRPGTALDVQCAYVLTSPTAEVEFEVREFLGRSDTVVSRSFDPSNL